MFSLSIRAGAAPLAAVIALFMYSEADAHAVCGSRVFPATLAIDDPGVGDELALEANIPINSDSGRGGGFIGEMHFLFDDLFPNSFGKPLFGGKS